MNIAALIAKKHQVTLIDEDKLPAGTYTGVVKPSDWPAGEATLKTLAAWSTPGSVFTVRSLRLIDVTDVTDNGTGGEPAPKKEMLVNLLPESLEKWSKEFEDRNAVIEGDLLSGWKLSVPESATDASARGYFGYTEIGENSLLLCYDFIIENGEAGIHLRAGLRQEGDKEVARTYANGKDSLTLTPYIAAVAGVKPIADQVYGEDRLPAGHYQGVICLDDAIPAAFKTEGYQLVGLRHSGQGRDGDLPRIGFRQKRHRKRSQDRRQSQYRGFRFGRPHAGCGSGKRSGGLVLQTVQSEKNAC